MKPSLKPETISYVEFEANRDAYESSIPAKLHALEDIRLHQIPDLLEQRKKDGDVYLEKTDISILVEWKLKHGTYRPNLAKLVASNSLQEVRKNTKNAFATYSENNANYAKAITALSKLKGIGPATASLILASYDPINIPFFSDELFRYLHWSEAKAKGWDRKINYSMKEYKDLYDRTQTLRQRLEKDSGNAVKAIDLEKMAYAIGKGAQKQKDLGKDTEEDEPLRPPSPKRRRKNSPVESKDPVEVCLRKGPRGSPTFDEMGYELDYDFIAKRCTGRPRVPGKRAQAKFERMGKENERKAEIMGILPKDTRFVQHWDDRVARDLGIAYHEVGMEEYEQWHKRGFKIEPGEFDDPSQEERDRVMGLMKGCALRKGSKHR